MIRLPLHDDALTVAAQLQIDPRRRLVLVAPHPDDEVIGFGGALFDHVAAGGRVVIVSITDGDAFDPDASPAARRAAAARRRAEQREALELLGVDPQDIVRLGVPDGGVADHLTEIVGLLRELLSSFRSDGEPLVVAPWRADWHPDHVATSRAVRDASDAELLEVPIWSWHRRHVHEPAWHAVSVVPISNMARQAKRAAIQRYRSQLSGLPNGRPSILSPEFLADFDRTFEIVVR